MVADLNLLAGLAEPYAWQPVCDELIAVVG